MGIPDGRRTARVRAAAALAGADRFVALGFGATAAVAWEVGEYYAFIRHSTELQSAYTDTLGDMALGTLGALLAGLIVFQTRKS